MAVTGLTGWEVLGSVDLGEFGADSCSLCGRKLRYLILCQSPNGTRYGLGAECAAKVQGVEPDKLVRLEKMLEREQSGEMPVYETVLGDGVPSSGAEGYPVTHIGDHLRVSFIPWIEPLPFHGSHSWYPSHGDDRIDARLYAVVSWRLADDPFLGSTNALYVPSNYNWPYGCTSFRGLALRDIDVEKMKALHPGRDWMAYDWHFVNDRGVRDESLAWTMNPCCYKARTMGASSYKIVRGYIDNIALAFTTEGRWNDDTLPTQSLRPKKSSERSKMTARGGK